MLSTVLELAGQDSRLRKQSYREYAGPCPDPRCRCRTDGFRVKWNGQEWVFMCRGCYESEQYLPQKARKRGWGDAIDYLRHYRGMSFREARAFLGLDEGDPPRERPPEASRPLRLDYREPAWQETTHRLMQEYVRRLWASEDTTALDYARGRGLSDATINKARLGYSLVGGVPRLVIPSVNDGQYVAIYRRDMRPDIPKEARWKDAAGGTKRELYLADCLKRALPTVLTEGPIDALSLVQECHDLVNVVATGGAECGQHVKGLAALARQPLVFVAFDADPPGDENATWWLDRLPNACRLRPLRQDVNAMLMAGWDLRQWVKDTLCEHDPLTMLADTCLTCGRAVEYYSPTGQAYCGACWRDEQAPVDEREDVLL